MAAVYRLGMDVDGEPQQGTSDQQDWRMQAELDVAIADAPGALKQIVDRLRGPNGPNLVEELQGAVPHDVVITHDGKLLFAYAADEATLASARKGIEDTLAHEGIAASIRVSHWDDEREQWCQTDPPLSAEEQAADAAARREADAPDTRTLVISSGKLVRAEVEQSMTRFAGELGLQVDVVEHPHLLKTQIAFTVTGPKGKVDEFARGLIAEGWATIRTELAVAASPL
jgi:hypothetical protein